jgi:hypothetical protein
MRRLGVLPGIVMRCVFWTASVMSDWAIETWLVVNPRAKQAPTMQRLELLFFSIKFLHMRETAFLSISVLEVNWF